MSSTFEVTVNQESFRKFIQCISYVTQFPVTLSIFQDRINILTASSDNASVFFLGSIKCSASGEKTIHIKDISKFHKLLEFNKNEENFCFSVVENYIIFKKEHVCEARFVLNSLPHNNLNLSARTDAFSVKDKILQARVTSSSLKDVLQSVHLASDTNKIYVYDGNGDLIAELNDKQADNIDSIKLHVSNSVQGHVSSPVVVNINSFRSLPINITDNFKFYIVPKNAGGKSYNVLLVNSLVNNVELNYLFNPIIQ